MNNTRDRGDQVRIEVALPLPLDVASTLMQLVGTAYPSAMTEMAGGRTLTMLIDPKDRRRLPGKKRVADDLKAYQPEEPIEDADLTRMGPDGIGLAPSEGLLLFLGDLAHRAMSAFETEHDTEVENYLGWECHVRTRAHDGEQESARDAQPVARYVLSIARSGEQTPRAMHERAKAELEVERARTAALRGLLNEAIGAVESAAINEDFWDRADAALAE